MEFQSNTTCLKLNKIQANVIPKELRHTHCSFGNTVSKELVHRAAISEVFLTDVDTLEKDKFYTGAHLPRTHSYYNDTPWRALT